MRGEIEMAGELHIPAYALLEQEGGAMLAEIKETSGTALPDRKEGDAWKHIRVALHMEESGLCRDTFCTTEGPERYFNRSMADGTWYTASPAGNYCENDCTVRADIIRGGRPDLGVCDSLEKGVIKLYNDVASRINSERDILLDDTDIDRIIRGEKTDYDREVLRIVGDMTRTFVEDILGTLRERGLDLKTSCVVFIGGGAVLLKKYLEGSDKIGRCIFVEDICANAKGYGLLYQIQRKGR